MNQLHEPVDNGYSNAYRHFYMAFGIARAVGADTAERFMAAHEARENGLETQMDSNNNAYALYMFRNNLAGGNFISYSFLTGLAQSGQLWTIQNGVLGKFPMPTGTGNPGPQN